MTESSTLELNQKILDLEARMRGLPVKKASLDPPLMSDNIKRVLNSEIPQMIAPKLPASEKALSNDGKEKTIVSLQGPIKKVCDIQNKESTAAATAASSVARSSASTAANMQTVNMNITNRKMNEKINKKLNQVSIMSFCDKKNWVPNPVGTAPGGGSCSMESDKLSNSKFSNDGAGAQVAFNTCSGSKIIAYETQKEVLKKKGLKRRGDDTNIEGIEGSYTEHYNKKQKTVHQGIGKLPSMKRLFVDEKSMEQLNFGIESDSGDEKEEDFDLEGEFNIEDNKLITEFFFRGGSKEEVARIQPNSKKGASKLSEESQLQAVARNLNNIFTQSTNLGGSSVSSSSNLLSQTAMTRNGKIKRIDSTSHGLKRGVNPEQQDNSKKNEALHPLAKENKKLTEDIKLTSKKIGEKNSQIRERDMYVEKLRQENMKIISEIKTIEDQHLIYKLNRGKFLATLCLEAEKLRKLDAKKLLNNQRERLGDMVDQRDGAKFKQTWIDGYEFKQLREKLTSIITEKEELEKKLKSLKNKKSSSVQEKPEGGLQNFFKNVNDTGESSDSVSDMKSRIQFQQGMLQKDESAVRTLIERLETEKFEYLSKKRMISEEEKYFEKYFSETRELTLSPSHSSIFGNENKKITWPCLKERYQLLSLLGKGGFSEVYKGFDLLDLKDVACKIHYSNPNWKDKIQSMYIRHLEREIEVHKEIKHPNIVRLYDFVEFEAEAQTYYAMILEYCEGLDLSLYMKKNKQIPEKEAKAIIKQIVGGIKYLHTHKNKIIHYDLKPQNILFHRGEVKIVDFGFCKVIQEDQSFLELTSPGLGTFWYLPPECFEKNSAFINEKVDIWSIGVIFYEMIYGEKPFGHNMTQEKIFKDQVILKANKVNFPSKPAVSVECKEFLKKCLAYDIEDRWDIHEMNSSTYLQKK